MDKRKLNTQTSKRRREKRCYGTKEGLGESLICKQCKWVEDCRKVNPKRKVNWSVNKS
jgi:hypothetical protein